jgi:ABC-type multidrug transport system fused ATPase/permease subunit
MKRNTSIKTFGRVMSFFWKNMPGDSLCASIFYILDNFSTTITTIIIAEFINSAYHLVTSAEQGITRIAALGAVFVGYNMLKQVFQIVSSISINAGVYEKSFQILNMTIAEKSARLPLVAYEDPAFLDMKKRAEDCAANDRFPAIFMLSILLITSVFGVLSLLLTMLYYHWSLAIIAAVSVAPFFFATHLSGKELFKLHEDLAAQKRKRDYIWSLFTDRRSIKEMLVMGFDKHLKGNWTAVQSGINRPLWKHELRESRFTMLCEFIKTVGYSLGVVCSLLLLINGVISIGVFGACLAAFVTVQNSIKQFFSATGRIPHFLSFAGDFIRYTDLDQERDEGRPYRGLKNEIRVTGLSFSYPNADREVLKNITMTIKAGEKIALVGENGSGKTTLTKVLMGIYAPAAGTLTYNGVPVNDLMRSDLFDRLAVVTQDFGVYNMTLRENVALSDFANINDDDRIRDSIRNVGLDELLGRTGSDENLDLMIGKEFGGQDMSIGQRQRLAIARVLFKCADFIILDEPTSAIDPLLETEIMRQFLSLARDKTALIISHRVGLCRMVDRVAVMNHGELVEFGPHTELLTLNGEYARLYNAQRKWYSD